MWGMVHARPLGDYGKVNAACLPMSSSNRLVGAIQKARLDKEYRRLFPDGKDLKRIYRLGTIMSRHSRVS